MIPSNLRINTQSVRDRVYDSLLKLILSGHLRPGQRLDLVNLAKQLGVSRTPLNEALQRLAQTGMVEVKPRSGTSISQIDADATIENFGFRQVMEMGAAPLVVEDLKASTLKLLYTLNEQMAELAPNISNADQALVFLEVDQKFHTKIMDIPENAVLSKNYHRAGVILQVMRMQRFHSGNAYEQVVVEHTGILEALSERDPTKLGMACASHIKASVHRFQAQMDAYDELQNELPVTEIQKKNPRQRTKKDT
ncbi:hypothetical protein A9Q96_13565 [Rhodobacterales bacterium 52_120_T64]|nr:hypothetical protein A9Q96_13565 [Rhodobacterales bacterium 52_120_T64]